MRAFAPPLPHGPIREVFPDVFFVRGSYRVAPGLTITRNMVIVREERALTLINSVRLGPQGEAELSALGEVQNIVKLGSFHGIDDPYYVDRFGSTLWALPAASHAGGLTTKRTLTEGTLPLRNAELFVFREGLRAEAALLLRGHGGVLVTCDSVQNWTDGDGCSLLGKLMIRMVGLRGPAVVGPIWLKAVQGNNRRTVENDFRRLLQLEWSHLLSAHGDPLRDEARDALRAQVEKLWGQTARSA